MIMRSTAFERFLQSMTLDYEKWHDGIGYDIDAIAQMTPAERDEICTVLSARDATWREVEALAAIDLPAARAAIEAASQDYLHIDTRLAAAEVMHERGDLKDIENFLAKQIRALTKIQDGLTRALLMAEQHPSETVKQALLWASWNRTECAPHCAALVAYLQGVAKEPFDWNLRPLFLRLGEHESLNDRKAAFEELCVLVKMELDTTQAY
jgi:hypothetical protein